MIRLSARALPLALGLWMLTTTATQAQLTRVIVEHDGWALVGDLVLPPAADAVPAVLLLNQAAGNRTVYAPLAAQLAARGIASLRLDLRGHGESINQGRFLHLDRPNSITLDGTEGDIAAAHRFLAAHHAIDRTRIAVVGASYSGEMMVLAAQAHAFAHAYVALSPGSFSEASIAALDGSGAAWLFVKSEHEPHLLGIEVALAEHSDVAEVLIVPGRGHATNLLGERADLAERIAVWLAYQLAAPANP